MANILFNIGVTGAAAATANVDALITKFSALKDKVVELVGSSEDYYDVVNRMSVDMRQFNQETKGLIDTMTSYRQANALTAAGVKITSGEIAGLGKAASEFAQATGEDITATFEKMTDAVIRGSSRGLVPFGVQLSQTTDKTAAAREAIEQLNAKYKNVEVTTDDLNERMFAFKNTMSTLSDQLAAPLFNNIISGLTGTKSGLLDVSGAMSSFSSDLAAGGQDFANWATSAEGALNIVSGVWAEITGNTEAATEAADEYYRKLQVSKQREKERRAEIEAQQAQRDEDNMLAANAVGLAEINAIESNWDTEQELGFGSGAKKRGGGGGGRNRRAENQSAQQAQIDAFREARMNAEMEMIRAQMEEEEAWTQQLADNELQIETDAAAQRGLLYQQELDAKREARNRELAEIKAYEDSKVEFARQGLGNVTSIMGSTAKMIDTQNEKGFRAAKGLALAQVAVDTPAAAMAAYKSASAIPVVGWVMGPLAAAAAITAGIAQAVTIGRQKYDKNGGGGSSISNNFRTTNISASAPAYGAGSAGGGGSTIVNNVILDGTMIHSSMLRVNDNAAQRGERSFNTAA
jgi:hypothetical protein